MKTRLAFLIVSLVSPLLGQADMAGEFIRCWNLSADAKIASHQAESETNLEDWIIHSFIGFAKIAEKQNWTPLSPSSPAYPFLPSSILDAYFIDKNSIRMTYIGGLRQDGDYYIATIYTYSLGQIMRITKPKEK